MGRLRLVIVALPGLFSNLFFFFHEDILIGTWVSYCWPRIDWSLKRTYGYGHGLLSVDPFCFLFYLLWLRVVSGPRVKLASCKSALNPPVVCSTDRSKAVVPVLVLLFVALWFILRGDFLYVIPCVILFLCFSVLLVLRLPHLGKRELILVLFVRLFGLCLFRFVGFLFLLGPGNGGTPWTFLLPFLTESWRGHIDMDMGCFLLTQDCLKLEEDILEWDMSCFLLTQDWLKRIRTCVAFCWPRVGWILKRISW